MVRRGRDRVPDLSCDPAARRLANNGPEMEGSAYGCRDPDPRNRERAESPLRAGLAASRQPAGPRLAQLQSQGSIELPMCIDGQWSMAGGSKIKVVQPHAHARQLGTTRTPPARTRRRRWRRRRPAPAWRAMSFDDRAAILLSRPQTCSLTVARHVERGDHAGPVEDRLPGRDRCRLRTDRFLALVM